jgi:hypothetical protein
VICPRCHPERREGPWFQRKLPGGEQLNIPMSAQLREIYRVIGLPE